MTYEFKFSPEFLNLILSGLAQLPYAQSAQAIAALQREVAEQDAKAKVAAIPADHVAKLDGNGAAEAQTGQ